VEIGGGRAERQHGGGGLGHEGVPLRWMG
jgi:hypothetical protein